MTEQSTVRWLWSNGLVRATLAWAVIGTSLAQAAAEGLPDPTPEQWALVGVIGAFYFAGALAQGVAAQTVEALTERRDE